MKVPLLILAATLGGTLAVCSLTAVPEAQAPVDLTGTWTGVSSDTWERSPEPGLSGRRP